MSLLNKNPVDVLQEPIFFGSDLGIARYDVQKHRIFEQLCEKQLSFFWRPEEVDLTTDAIQFQKLPDTIKDIFTNNLKYQILLDTLQGSAPSKTLGPIISDTSFDTWVQTWTFSETIHSRSYTHILRNLFANPSEVFDEIVKDKAIMARAEAVTRYYDELDAAVHDYISAKKTVDSLSINDENKSIAVNAALEKTMRKLYVCMHSINALEAIRFYVSFSCSFNFFEHMKVLEGNSKIIKLIARDEQLHLKGTQYVLRLIQNGGEGEAFARIAKEEEENAIKVFLETVQQELDWIDHLYTHEELPGLPKQDLRDYVFYLAKSRMRAAGLPIPSIIEELAPKHHPIPWIRPYLDSSEVQVAPQEVEISSYLVAQIDHDVDEEVMKNFKKYKK